MFRLLEAITLLWSAWRWILIAETCRGKILKKNNKVVLDYNLSLDLIIGYTQLENVEPFKYLGSMLTNDGIFTCEIKSRIVIAKAAFNKKRARFTGTLDLKLRKKLVKCYIWSTGLYGAETWTLRAVDQKHLENFEMWCWRRMEMISWTDHVTNEEVVTFFVETAFYNRLLKGRKTVG